MITLDASVVIAHLSSHDPHHESATALLRDHAAEDLVIHPLNLAEILVGGVRAGRGAALVADLRAIGLRSVTSDDGEPLRLATLRVETGLKLPDCCALDAAEASGSTLATFDDQLAKAARERHVVVRPDR